MPRLDYWLRGWLFTMTSFENTDLQEIGKFDKVSQIWWDPHGEMGTLHTINPLRTDFIMRNLSDPHPRILDVGCGGGILSEALAKRGAQVVAIDLSEPSLQVARRHAEAQRLAIDYRYASAEETAARQTAQFDAVTCMEMLEHVPEPAKVIAACAQALKPGGHAYFSTINRTLKSLLFAIVAGEYFLHLLPRGTHTYSKLIQPRELKAWAAQGGLVFSELASLIFNPLTGSWKVAPNFEDVNYMAHFTKPA